MNRRLVCLFCARVVSLAVGLLTLFVPLGWSQANVTGTWQTLPYTTPINPIHVALLYTGKVLIVSGTGNNPQNPNMQAGIWDPQAGTITVQTVDFDMFCNGMVTLPDGRALIAGGTLSYGPPFLGSNRVAIYDPATGVFTDQQSMAHGRWYPTLTTLGDGRVIIYSGLSDMGPTNTTIEIFGESSGLSAELATPWTPPLYPRLHLLPNGTLFYSGLGSSSNIYDPSSNTWTLGVAKTNYGGQRLYGSSVLLPMTPANGYKPRVMLLGGGSTSAPSTNTTEIIDLSVASPQWVYGPAMSHPRIEMDATILPDGRIVALGGSTNDEDATTAALGADLYNPTTNTMSAAGTEAFARLYHTVSLLMPDGTVWVAGGNPAQGNYEPHMEIYSPPYLFNADGTLATRPTITSTSTSKVGYGAAFTIQTPDAANISSVVLMHNGASTHAFDMDQRYVGLSFTAGSGVLNVTGPPTSNIAPPGYYMVFLVNNSGVPSVATMVQVSSAPTDQPPTGTITSPASDVTVNAGQSVTFAGTGTSPSGTISSYFWSFVDGNPSSSNVANPGAVTYSIPGTHAATFTVTDNQGVPDPHPPSRTITVPDFTLAASPSLSSVNQGANTPYTITATGGTGFVGNLSLSVSGLPAGASAAFNPASIANSGSSTMTVSTGTAAAGEYSLTVTASTGVLSHTATVSLVINSSSVTTPINLSSGFSAAGMQFNGHARLNGSRLQLTDNNNNEVGTAFWTTPVNVQAFTTDFTFQLTNAFADGFTFILQNVGPTALGGGGSGLGSQGLATSVAVKFDLFSNAGEGNNSTGVYLNGATPTVPATTIGGGVSLHSGDVLEAHITYDGTTLTLTLTDTVTLAAFTTSWAVNIPGTVGANTAFAGFGGGTGGQSAIQEILGWSYSTGAGAQTAAATPVITPATGSYATAQTVTITDTTAGSTIFYTLDGTAPGTAVGGSTQQYTAAFQVAATTTVKALATASGFATSGVATSVITIQTGTTAINFGSGFTAAGMQFNGTGKLVGTALQLTDNAAAGNEAGSAYWTTGVGVGTFTTDFTFQVTLVNAGADGFTFILQNAGLTALGPVGGGLGSAGLTPSVAVKFDLFDNQGEGNNSTGLYTDGNTPTVPATNLGGGSCTAAAPCPSPTTFAAGIPNLHSGDVMHVHMTYDGTTLTMTITDTAVPADTYTTSWAVNIPGTLGAATAFAGFTGADGGLTAQQQILTWTYTTGAGASPAATPTFSPVAGTYAAAQSVTISDTTAGSTIFYTTDGTTPGTTVGGSTQQFNAATPISVTASETIKAVATAPGFATSGVGSAAYVISAATATPVITPTTGTYTGTQTVTITDATPNSTIFYTLDGTTPGTVVGGSTKQYAAGGFQVAATTTVKALATATGFATSAVATSTLTIQGTLINFANGFTATNMQFNAHTKLNGTRLQLTDTTAKSEEGSAYWKTAVNITSFATDFNFQLTNPNSDGFTFLVQKLGLTAIGTVGGGLGFAGLNHSVAIKFDLWNNDGEGNNSTGLYVNGSTPSVPATNLGGGSCTAAAPCPSPTTFAPGIPNLHSGDIFHVHMTYNGTTLTMTITDTNVPADTFTTSWNVNIPGILGANTAFAGFTGSTGGQTATQEILTWTYAH